tara:strand:- start:678 stop:977 length:300 start_codon:yes stop_codon:yes gene_type:complete
MERKEDQEEKKDPVGDPVSMSAPAERQENRMTPQQREALERVGKERRDAGALRVLNEAPNFLRFQQQRALRLERQRQERLRKIAEDDERQRQTRNAPIP